jgi:hypothetical protein
VDVECRRLHKTQSEQMLGRLFSFLAFGTSAGQCFDFETTWKPGNHSSYHAALPAGVYSSNRGFQHGDRGQNVVMRLRPSSEVFKDRRRSPRTQANCLQLAYWDGSSVLRRIREVSSHGAFVETQNHWCPGTVLRTHLIAELPLPVLSEGVAPGGSTPGNGAPKSSGNHNVLHTKSARLTETVSIPLTCRVVRLVDEGICVAFIHRSKKQRLALESFLMTVIERTWAGEANAREATATQPTNETVVPQAPKDRVWRFAERPVKVHPALQGLHLLWGTVLGECARIQRFQRAAYDQLVAIPFLSLVSPTAQPGEIFSGAVAAAPPIPIEPNEIAPSNIWGPR